jgi:tRNA(Ile)-lysidine synthase
MVVMSTKTTHRDRTGLAARVLHYCRAYGLFEPGVAIVGVSGGIDSLALLHLLVALRIDLDVRLHVATLDHGLRGAAGAADAEFVRQTADDWGLPVTVGHTNVLALAREQGLGIE